MARDDGLIRKLIQRCILVMEIHAGVLRFKADGPLAVVALVIIVLALLVFWHGGVPP